jgi:general secretion pathway protein D
MIRLLPSRVRRGIASLACCGAVTACCAIGQAQTSEPSSSQDTVSVPAQASESANPASGMPADIATSTVSKRQAHAADEAYLAGAKKLRRDDFAGAEDEFERALAMNPNNGNYAAALSMARERQVNELVQHSSQARLSGDDTAAATLLAEARLIDPQNPMVIEHSGPFVRQAAGARRGAAASWEAEALLADRSRMLADAQATAGASTDWQIEAPVAAGAIQLAPASTVKSFDLRGSASDILQSVAQAYGIRVVVDDSLEQTTLRFNLQNATYEQAIGIALNMAHAFAVPIDEKSVIVAMESPDNRKRLERQMEETIYLPALSVDQINDLAQVVRTVFDVKQASIETGLGKIILRAPANMLDPLNLTLKGLLDGSGEVMVEVKLYEVAKTHTINAGATIPNQFTVFNVDQAADSIVNANQTLVQQAIAQGYITSSTSNLDIALALIQLGLVQSNLATNLIGVFGGGLLKTGVSGSTGATLNLGLNSSDTRTLDDVQLRVGDRQIATFREGEKYPIVQSTYSTGGTSSLPPGVANATINGVPVSSLLSQITGGSSATIPIVTYEDLGITLKATPSIQRSGRINLTLDMKIDALSGSSFDGNPILNSRQFATDLTVADGESALMVSDVNKNESDSISGLPGLSGLPGFQVPLDDTRDRGGSQLVLVVTPHVIRRRPDMIAGPRIAMHGAPPED